MNLKIVLTFVLIFSFSFLSAQTSNYEKQNNDLIAKLSVSAGAEKVAILYQLAELNIEINRLKTLEYLNEAIKTSKKTAISLELEANIYRVYGDYYYIENNYKKSAKYYNKELKIVKKEGNKKYICETEFNIATIYLGSYRQSRS